MALWSKSKINRDKIQKPEQGRQETACLHTLKKKKPFYESSVTKVGNYFILKNKLRVFFFSFPSTFPFGTLACFSTIVKLVKSPIHNDWFGYVLFTLKLFSCQLKNCVCRLRDEIHSWNVCDTPWSGVSQRDLCQVTVYFHSNYVPKKR